VVPHAGLYVFGQGLALCREVWMSISQQEVTGSWDVCRESHRQAFPWTWRKEETRSLQQTPGQRIQ